jgi:hypothetical protein
VVPFFTKPEKVLFARKSASEANVGIVSKSFYFGKSFWQSSNK